MTEPERGKAMEMAKTAARSAAGKVASNQAHETSMEKSTGQLETKMPMGSISAVGSNRFQMHVKNICIGRCNSRAEAKRAQIAAHEIMFPFLESKESHTEEERKNALDTARQAARAAAEKPHGILQNLILPLNDS